MFSGVFFRCCLAAFAFLVLAAGPSSAEQLALVPAEFRTLTADDGASPSVLLLRFALPSELRGAVVTNAWLEFLPERPLVKVTRLRAHALKARWAVSSTMEEVVGIIARGELSFGDTEPDGGEPVTLDVTPLLRRAVKTTPTELDCGIVTEGPSLANLGPNTGPGGTRLVVCYLK